MIGIYDYTVVLTYLSLFIAMLGIGFSIEGSFEAAIICLMVCGGLDMLDGPVARTKKDRTKQGKAFGIQIDSLNDFCCFGVLPAVIGFTLLPEMGLEKVILGIFPLAGLIRLAFYNVQEEERQSQTSEKRKYYTGLPITMSSIIMPMLFVLRAFVTPEVFYVIWLCGLLVLSVLYLLKIPVPKPHLPGMAVMFFINLAVLIRLIMIM